MRSPEKEKRRYSLESLLAQCDAAAPFPECLKVWMDAQATGKEAWATGSDRDRLSADAGKEPRVTGTQTHDPKI